jgi:ADP-ribosylglycohydrolase
MLKPAEHIGVHRKRIEQRWRGQWRHRFFLGHGIWSDDTEHTFFVAQALLSEPKDSYHSVPVALYAWLRSPNDYREALTSALNCGGDTDTVGAIVGALSGAFVRVENISAEWRSGIVEWPRSVALLAEIGRHLADQKSGGHIACPVKYFWPGLALRNLLFLITVLVHGFRRLLP